MRAKKTFKNAIWGFIFEIAAIGCGFILPRLILTSFGSDYNGITSSITQFLQVISLFQAGIGGVTMAALYKPLAEKDTEKISGIIKTTESYLHKVILLFAGLTLVISCGYPFLVIDEFDWFFTASLVWVMSISSFTQYFFGQTYQFLLCADQNQHLISKVNIAKIVGNTVISAVMIRLGFGIREVKLAAAVVFVAAPIFVSLYAKKKYKIMPHVKKDNSLIKERWDNFGQQVAVFVAANTPLVVLTFFSNVYEISVYTVYILIINGITSMFTPLVNGVDSAFGNMMANDEKDLVSKNLRIYEQVVFAAATFLFTVALITALPFIALYTAGVTDVNYHRPAFLHVMIAASMFLCFRTPYEGIAKAAGHFRQTRNPAFVEAAVNIVLSVVLVFPFGLTGVAVGLLAAYMFRAFRFALYTSKNLLHRSIRPFLKRLLLSGGCLLTAWGLFSVVPLWQATNFFLWILNAVIVSLTVLLLVAAVEVIFYRDDLKNLIAMIKGLLKNRKAVPK